MTVPDGEATGLERVVRPRSSPELADAVIALQATGERWVVRGGRGFESRLPPSPGAVTIETAGLSRIRSDRGDEVTVEAGVTWFELFEYLARDRRRPVVLPDALRATVGATLATGGAGDTSHRFGLAIDHVRELVVIAADGSHHRTHPSDDLFQYMLGGRGQLGVIAEATLAVASWPTTVATRAYALPSLGAYLALVEAWRSTLPFARARLFWRRVGGPNPISVVLGVPATGVSAAPPAILPGATAASEPMLTNLVERERAAPRSPPVARARAPALHLILPLARAESLWSDIDAAVRATGLPARLRDGIAIAVVAPNPAFPLALRAAGGPCLLVSLEPHASDEDEATRIAAWLRELAGHAVRAGAGIHAGGVEPTDARWPAVQYGELAWAAWRALKARYDPHRQCNPWHL